MTLSVFRCLSVGILLVGALSVPRECLATSYCFREPPCEYVLNPSKTAFVGRVVSNAVTQPVENEFYRVVTQFVIEEVFGADVEPMVSIITQSAGTPQSARTVFLPEGALFLVYAQRHDGQWRLGSCSLPIRIADASKDLEALRAAKSGPAVPSLSGSVSLTTWDQGSLESAPNITVTATEHVDGHDSAETSETTTDVRGEYRFLRLPPGQYRIGLKIDFPLKPTFDLTTLVEFHGCMDGVSLFVTTASFVGIVRGVDAIPVENTRIHVVEAGEPEHSNSDFRRDVFTDKLGRWSMDGVPNGQYVISLNEHSGPSASSPYAPMWYPGVSDASRAEVITLDDSRPQRVDFAVLTPLPTGTITGIVVDAAGRPATRAWVKLTDAELPAGEVNVTTDQEGRFTMPALLTHRLTLVAEYFNRDWRLFVSEPLALVLFNREDGAPVTQEVRLSVAQPRSKP